MARCLESATHSGTALRTCRCGSFGLKTRPGTVRGSVGNIERSGSLRVLCHIWHIPRSIKSFHPLLQSYCPHLSAIICQFLISKTPCRRSLSISINLRQVAHPVTAWYLHCPGVWLVTVLILTCAQQFFHHLLFVPLLSSALPAI